MVSIARLVPALLVLVLLAGWAPARAFADDGLDGVYSEVLPAPEGDPSPTLLYFHGGGWLDVGEQTVHDVEVRSRALQALGWTVWSVDYHAGRASRADSHAWLDRVLAARPGSPVCVAGESAGSQLALMLAAERPGDVRCAIGLGAVTWLNHFGGGLDDSPSNRLWDPDYEANSPIDATFAPGQRLLLATSAADSTTTCDRQLTPFAQRHPEAVTRCLPSGTPGAEQAPFVHAPVDRDALVDLTQLACQTLRAVSAATRCPDDPPPLDPPPVDPGQGGGGSGGTGSGDGAAEPGAGAGAAPAAPPGAQGVLGASAVAPPRLRVRVRRWRIRTGAHDRLRVEVRAAVALRDVRVCVFQPAARWVTRARPHQAASPRVCWTRRRLTAPLVVHADNRGRVRTATVTVRARAAATVVRRVDPPRRR